MNKQQITDGKSDRHFHNNLSVSPPGIAGWLVARKTIATYFPKQNLARSSAKIRPHQRDKAPIRTIIRAHGPNMRRLDVKILFIAFLRPDKYFYAAVDRAIAVTATGRDLNNNLRVIPALDAGVRCIKIRVETAVVNFVVIIEDNHVRDVRKIIAVYGHRLLIQAKGWIDIRDFGLAVSLASGCKIPRIIVGRSPVDRTIPIAVDRIAAGVRDAVRAAL